jgi:hypothetical protein
METPNGRPNLPNCLAEQPTWNELVKMIRKLRWVGLPEEAERAERELIRRREAAAVGGIPFAPHETD